MTPSVPAPLRGAPVERGAVRLGRRLRRFPFFRARPADHDRATSCTWWTARSSPGRVPADPGHRSGAGPRGEPAARRPSRRLPDGKVLDPHGPNLFLIDNRDMDLTGEIDFSSAWSGATTASASPPPRPVGPTTTTSPTTAASSRRPPQRRQAGTRRRRVHATTQATPARPTAASASRPSRAATSSSAGPTACSSTEPPTLTPPSVELTAPAAEATRLRLVDRGRDGERRPRGRAGRVPRQRPLARRRRDARRRLLRSCVDTRRRWPPASTCSTRSRATGR